LCTIAKFDPLRGDAVFELDAKLAKNFKIGERARIQIVAQAFNLTNRANYGNNFGGNISSGEFGHPIGFIAPNATFIPRSIWGEMGVHFTFSPHHLESLSLGNPARDKDFLLEPTG
jgi:hypothetical protein